METEADRRHKERMRAQEEEHRIAFEERGRLRREAEAQALKARYRQGFPGSDAEFESAWPALVAKIAEDRAKRPINPL